MSEIIGVAFAIFSGLCLYAGLNHLGRARTEGKRAAHLLFSAAGFLGAVYAILTLHLYRTNAVPSWISWTIVQYCLATAILSLFALFSAYYADIRTRRALWIVLALHIVSVFAVLLFGAAAVAPGLEHLRSVTFSWGETIFVPAESINKWVLLLDLPAYATLFYMFYACVHLRRSGETRTARIFGTAVAIVLAGVVLADLNTYLSFSPIMFPEFGFLAMMLFMSLNLSTNLAEAHYRAFIADSMAICRIGFDPPIPMDVSEKERLRLALERAYVADCNERFAQARGGTIRECIGLGLSTFSMLEDAKNQENFRRIVQADFNIRGLEMHGKDLAGNDLYFLSDFYGDIQDGRLVRLWLAQENITEKKQAEQSAKRSEEGLELALDAARIGVWRWDVESNKVQWSATVGPIFGLKAGEFDGTFDAVESMIHPSDRRRIMAVIQQCMFGKREEFHVEHRIVWNDGSIRWVEARGRSRLNERKVVEELRGTIMDVSDRKRADLQVRESRERFSRLCEATFEGIAISLEGRIIDANEQLARMLGYEVSEIIGRSPMDLAAEEWVAHVEHNVRTEHEGAYEHMARRKDGNVFPVEIRARMMRVGDQVWRVSAVRDISDRIAAQKALRESAERFRLVAEQTGQLIYDYDLSSRRFIQWAGGIEPVTGYTPEDFRALTLQDFASHVHPADKPDVLRHIEKSLSLKRPFQIEYRFKTKNGSYVVLEDRGVFLKDESGEATRMLGSISDITSRRKAEDAVKAIARGVSSTTGDAFFRTLVENLGIVLEADFVFVGEVPQDLSRADSIAVWTTQGITDNFSYSLDGTPCQTVSEGRPCTIPAGIAAQFPSDKLLADWGVEGYSGVPLLNAVSEVIGLMVVLFKSPIHNPAFAESTLQIFASRAAGEIERRRSEARVLEMNLELEQRVEQRTQELSSVNRELESFSYSVSHDLRAPLRNISGFVELLSGSAAGLDAENRRYLETIAKEVRRMGTLIDDLIELSRVTRTEMLFTTVYPSSIVKEVCESFAMDTRGRSIDWQIGHLPIVRGDRSLLQQVFMNLISNAVKYTQYCPQTVIEVGWSREKSTDKALVFFVRDNGVGFNMKYVGKLFGVFQRLHSVKQFEGTGIGLANVQRIIFRHGGKVWADAAVNQGATFYFSLPA